MFTWFLKQNNDAVYRYWQTRTHCCSSCFLDCANWETFVAKRFWTKSETFFVSRTQNLCPQQMLRARTIGKTFVSATMCPQQSPRLPGPQLYWKRLTGTNYSNYSFINRTIFTETSTSVFSEKIDFLSNKEDKYNFSEKRQDAENKYERVTINVKIIVTCTRPLQAKRVSVRNDCVKPVWITRTHSMFHFHQPKCRKCFNYRKIMSYSQRICLARDKTFNKLTSVFHASVMLLILNFVTTLSK